MTKKPTGKKTKQPKKVWHIFHFEDRFEMPEAKYKGGSTGPMPYTKDFVLGKCDESISYHQQMLELKSRPDFLQLKGAFSELKNFAARRTRKYRGYLLDEKMEPATMKKISIWLGIEQKEATRILKVLAAVNLIERVDMPNFNAPADPQGDGPGDEPQPDPDSGPGGGSGDGPPDDDQETPQAAPAGGPRRVDATSQSAAGTNPEISGNFQKALRAKNNNPNSNDNCNEKQQQQKQQKPQPDHRPAVEKQKARKTETPEQRKQRIIQELLSPDERAKNNEQALNPASAPPFTPTESDAGGDRQHMTCTNPPPSLYRGRGDPAAIGSVLNGWVRDRDPDAQRFAVSVFNRLGVPHSMDSPPGKRQLANFAQAWMDAKATVPSGALVELWDKSMKEADKMSRKPRSSFRTSREAAWRWTFNQRMNKYSGVSANAV